MRNEPIFNSLRVLHFALESTMGSIRADDPYPAACCPTTCVSIEGAAKLVAGSVGSQPISLIFDGRRIPVSESVYQAGSSDNRTHMCIGYDPFGDEEISCLFTPTIM